MLNRRIFIILFIFLANLTDINGQIRPRRTRPRQVRPKRVRQEKPRSRKLGNKNDTTFTLRYDFSMQAIPNELKFITPIPKNISGRQRISEIDYSTEPSKVFDKNGTKYAEFSFRKPPNQFSLHINIKATLSRYDLATAKKQHRDTSEDMDPNHFLKNERYIEKDNPQIQQIAQNIKGTTQIALVKKLYDYVVDNVRYINIGQEQGAIKTLRKKQGACTDYSDLFVALCRAKGISARVVKGYVTEAIYLPQHAWTEVYFKEYGWVPFDLTYGDVEKKPARDRNFENLKPIYVYLTNIRNDEVLDRAISISGYMLGDVNVNHSIEFK